MSNTKRMWVGAIAVGGLIATGWLARPHLMPAAEVTYAPVDAVPAPPPVAPVEPARITHTVQIGQGDTVLAALMRSDVPGTEAHAIVASLRDAGVQMRQIRPGDTLQLQREDSSGRVVQVSFAPTPWLRFDAEAGGDGWSVRRSDIAPDVRVEVRRATIEASLWDAVSSGAMSPQMLLDMAQIFEGDIDFSADTRPGDEIRLLVEARYAGGMLIDHGRILAAQYVGERTVTGVAFTGADGRDTFYDAEGRSLKKTFLRSPLQFTRISSGYTHRRPHPVLGGVRPHLAIDYAAPIGTPVWAVADGVVEHAGWKGGNGIQVLLRHKGGYRTYYNHLSRVAKGLRPGVRVQQKQVIGQVGSTGISTGPHLDYRVSHNGKFVNPLNEKFAPGEPIPEAERARFVETARAYVAQFDVAPAQSAALK
jgi:murein DD-endopeptidase MepM/ murein hydrolase activator NlpD